MAIEVTMPQMGESIAEGSVLAERIAGKDPHPINYDHVPGCTYCDPEIGSIGLTEKEAGERGYDVRVGTFPFGVLGRAKIAGEIEGFVKIVAEKKYDEVLKVALEGPLTPIPPTPEADFDEAADATTH